LTTLLRQAWGLENPTRGSLRARLGASNLDYFDVVESIFGKIILGYLLKTTILDARVVLGIKPIPSEAVQQVQQPVLQQVQRGNDRGGRARGRVRGSRY